MSARLDTRSQALRWLLLLTVGALVVHVASYWRFLSDDSLISLRYADRWVDGHGLTWTDGERVEGYTDLLWVLPTGALHALGADLVWTAQGLAFLGVLSGVVLLGFSPESLTLDRGRLLSGSLGLALSPPAAIWAIGGLEHGMMVGVIVAALFTISRAQEEPGLGRATWGAAGLLSSLVLLRADGAVLVFGLVLPCIALRSRRWFVRFLLWALLPAAILGAQHLFRHAYYGQWVPNTAAAKVTFSAARMAGGFAYVGRGLLALWPLLIVLAAFFAASVKRMRFARWGPALSCTIVWCLYLASVGGDIFPGWRQLLPGLVPLYSVFAETTAFLLSKQLPLPRQLATLGCLLGSGVALVTQSSTMDNLRGRQERWEWVGASLGPVLKQAFAEQAPLLAVDAAGALPYWSKLPSLDMLGLNDYHIAHHPPVDFGSGTIGHDLGDGAYVLSRKPDLIAFNNAGGTRVPLFLSGIQMARTSEFQQKYRLIRVKGLPPLQAIGELHARIDGRIGFLNEGTTTRIPGYFLSAGFGTAELDPDGKLSTKVEPGVTAVLYGLRLPPGTYRLSARTLGRRVDWEVRCRNRTLSVPFSNGETTFIQVGQQPVSVHAASTQGVAWIREVAMEKVAHTRAAYCSNRHVRLPFSYLARRKPENHPWDAPGNAVFSGAELAVVSRDPVRATHVLISVDNNDVYVLRFLQNGREVGTAQIDPKDNGGGLANHRVAIPDRAAMGGFDEIRVRAGPGDGAMSVGHLIPVGTPPARKAARGVETTAKTETVRAPRPVLAGGPAPTGTGPAIPPASLPKVDRSRERSTLKR